MEKKINETRALSKDCKYSYVMAVVKRAKQLRRKAKEKNIPFDEVATVKSNHIKALTVALDEFNAGNISLKIKNSVDEQEKKEAVEDVETKAPVGEESVPPEEKQTEVPAETA